MDKLTLLLALGLGICSVYAWYERAQAVTELVTLRHELAAHNEQAVLKQQLTTLELLQGIKELGEKDATRLTELDQRFAHALSELELGPERLHDHPSAPRYDLPDATAPAAKPRASTTTSAPQTSCGLYQTQSAKLERRLTSCETRLLQEARDFDALATHYQTLLSIYHQARESLNDYNQDQARPQEKEPREGR